MTELLLFDSWLTFLDALVWKVGLDKKKKQSKTKRKKINKCAVFIVLKGLVQIYASRLA